MKRRVFSILTALALCLSLLPTAALAAAAEDGVYVAGKKVTTGSYNNSGESVTENATITVNMENKILTLNGAAISVTTDTTGEGLFAISDDARLNITAAIVFNTSDAWTVKLVGSNSVTATSSYVHSNANISHNVHGIYAKGDLTFCEENSGSLTIEVKNNGNQLSLKNPAYGIYAKNITINSGTVTASTASKNNALASYGEQYSDISGSGGSVIRAEESVTITGGTVTVTNTNLDGNGITAYKGDVTISGGTVTAIAKYANPELLVDDAVSYASGIYAGEDVTISNADVTIEADDAGGKGIEAGTYNGDKLSNKIAKGNISISSGTVNVSAGEMGMEVAHSNQPTIEITGGTVTVDSDETGLRVGSTEDNAAVSVTGGMVKVEAEVEAVRTSGAANTTLSTGDYTGTVSANDDATISVSGTANVTGNITAGENSTINVSGGSVGSISTGTDSTVTVSSGSVTGDITMAGVSETEGATAVLKIEGGTVGGNVSAGAGATTTISGETTVITGNVTTGEGGTTAISNGTIGGNVETAEGATTEITGGTLTNDTDAPVADGFYRDETTGEIKPGSAPAPTPTPAPAPSYDSDPSYSIKKVEGVKQSHRNAEAGETVTLTITDDAIIGLIVTDRKGNEIELTDEGNGKYSFEMPKGTVTITPVYAEEEPETLYTDVEEDHWAAEAIAWAAEEGLMTGTTAETFNPAGKVSRQQVWMILARMSGYGPEDMAAAKGWAVSTGVSDGTAPGTAVTRQQLVTLIWRAEGEPEGNVSVLADYPDVGSVSGYAQEALAWAVENGVIGGTVQGTLNPQGTATRAQLATILYRYVG